MIRQIIDGIEEGKGTAHEIAKNVNSLESHSYGTLGMAYSLINEHCKLLPKIGDDHAKR